MSNPDPGAPYALPERSRLAGASRRVLACVLCSQRKVKCDRKFPCANCLRQGTTCVPASALAPRPRRRRFPEKEMLDRIRHYEGLLRQNNIDFEPLHPSPADDSRSPSTYKDSVDSPDAEDLGDTKTLPEKQVNIWHAMNQRDRPEEIGNNEESESSDDEVRPALVKDALDTIFQKSDEVLLFGSSRTVFDLSILHPEPVHIFRLWQAYLDNVDPLFKVTHTPTLQTRVVNAIGNLSSLSPVLEALMFSIYCIAVVSLSEVECMSIFGIEKANMLARYQFGCQQALLGCGILRTTDRDCLTALFLYFVAVKPGTDPHSLSSMLGIAVRLAQRMGMHVETSNLKHNVLEAEMRRRLWWALAIFDARISEMCQVSDTRISTLVPTWDCKKPLNVNDFDLRPEMKAPPPTHEVATEATLVVVRSEMADFIRSSVSYLSFVSPALRHLAKGGAIPENGEIANLEKMIEERYLSMCDLENPLQFMTIFTARGYLAKNRLMEHYSRYSSTQQTDAQRDAALCYALTMFECDTQILTSPLTQGFYWHNTLQFPFQAYLHVAQDLKRRPFGQHAERAWRVMCENYEARLSDTPTNKDPLTKILSKVVFQAWAAREAFPGTEPPSIVTAMRRKVSEMTLESQFANFAQLGPTSTDANNNGGFMSLPMGLGGDDPLFDFQWPESTDPGPVDLSAFLSM
ncbi:hypothetical protein BCR34DRAFT_625638 [Clohesyomyces aquaticus]|uniref:Zn(2)-C6 fungal-type domain-containing protein n=1 Tax=Clohesyomyces aquaticus TaxID=1231657 RepID=A0A1Y1ZHB1_9PLEO|nr:hypothetical protein BCR34DRAFT_625638 [Clohesyomyces aquaticus]